MRGSRCLAQDTRCRAVVTYLKIIKTDIFKKSVGQKNKIILPFDTSSRPQKNIISKKVIFTIFTRILKKKNLVLVNDLWRRLHNCGQIQEQVYTRL